MADGSTLTHMQSLNHNQMSPTSTHVKIHENKQMLVTITAIPLENRLLKMVYNPFNGGHTQFSHFKLNVGLNHKASIAQEKTHKLRVWSQRARI